MAFDLLNHCYILSYKDNLVPDAVIGATSSSSVYPSNNVRTLSLVPPWRATDVPPQSLYLDLGASPADIDAIAVVDHNISSAGKIEAFHSDTTERPSVNKQELRANVLETGISALFFDTPLSGQRYWTLKFTDTSLLQEVRVGAVVIGKMTELPGWEQPPSIVDRKLIRQRRTNLGVLNSGAQISKGHEFDLTLVCTSYAELLQAQLNIEHADMRRYPALVRYREHSGDVFYSRQIINEAVRLVKGRDKALPQLYSIGFTSEMFGRFQGDG